MSSIKDRTGLLKELVYAGYSEIREPYDISSLSTPDTVVDCEAIAQKHFFKIWYLDVKSNWKKISQEVAKKSEHPCLVITSFENHTILATVKNHNTHDAKPRYVVMDNSKPQLYSDFIKSIKVESNDNFLDAYNKVQDAFDKFSKYAQAIDEFGANLEDVISFTRDKLERSMKGNTKYNEASDRFLDMCKTVISNRIEHEDIKEMLIQHILTYDIFSLLYDSQEFHKTNAVARSLENLTKLLGISIDKMNVDYAQIKLVAETLESANDRQEFLHGVYETFYAKYNPARANKDGIVYTPSEVVNFMVESANHLMEKHFDKSLSDKHVTILDPATGTGTFIASILRHLKPDSIKDKYKNDLFANEISILPYYIAALNIQNTYRELTGNISEFENVCWMDTLDVGTKDFGKISSYLDGQDNIKRISAQQQKTICLVIGNPPYNASQTSFNDANPADKYPDIDKKIEETYVSESSVISKNQQYDMYKRFLKWSSERIKGQGMVAFVSNNSFLDAKSDDGFRKSVYEEFDYIYTVNLKGNARLAGDAWKQEGGKIFGGKARVGVVISFFIKTGENKSKIQYAEVDDYLKTEDKLKWLVDNSLSTLQLKQLIPDEDANWLNQTNNDFDELVPILSKDGNSIFELLSMGSMSGRDDWAFDIDKNMLENKIKYYIDFYNKTLDKYGEKPKDEPLKDWVDKKIKWTDDTLNHLKRGNRLTYLDTNIINTLYRPFVSKLQYFDKMITHRQRKFPIIFKNSQKNKIICFVNPQTNSTFQTLASDRLIEYHLTDTTQCIPLYIYDDGKPHSNVTKFGLKLFQKHYKNNKITNEDVFYYTYAIFNDPRYGKKYKFNLQRKLPRIPLAENFETWAGVGKKLYDIHVGFESAKLYPLKRTDKKTNKNHVKLVIKKPKNQDKGSALELSKIIIDDQTTLEEIPNEAIQYMFSSKCALEWILEFYKESKHSISDKSCDDEKIRKKFNTYKFADHKEHVIDLLQRVTTISIETMKLRKELEKLPIGDQPKWNLEESDKKSSTKKKIQKTKITKRKKPSKKKIKETSKITKLDNFAS